MKHYLCSDCDEGFSIERFGEKTVALFCPFCGADNLETRSLGGLSVAKANTERALERANRSEGGGFDGY